MKNHIGIRIAIADDNLIFRAGLCQTINNFQDFTIVCNEEDCESLLSRISTLPQLPDICIIDMSMPGGYQILKLLKESYPTVKVLILSMLDNELSIIRTIKIGANGFLLKGCTPADLHHALITIHEQGYHYPEAVTMQRAATESLLVQLSYSELEMLSLSCTEMNMRQIAEQMQMSLKAAEKCRTELMRKLSLKSRVGLVLFAMNMGVQRAE